MKLKLIEIFKTSDLNMCTKARFNVNDAFLDGALIHQINENTA